jgi:hypothetical protein
MGEAVQSIFSEPNKNVEIIVHVDESLDEQQRDDLIVRLQQDEAINSAEFCPLRYHLMLVNYDREMLTSQDVLGRVTSNNIHAKLIGPV